MFATLVVSLQEQFYRLVTMLSEDPVILFWLGATSLLFFILSLLIIPWLVIRIPANYFSQPAKQRSTLIGDQPLLRFIFKIVRNSVAVVLILLGVLMLVLPGQGLLTVLIGIAMADFPGKHKLVLWLVSKESVHRPMNWLRQRANREPIVIELPRR